MRRSIRMARLWRAPIGRPLGSHCVVSPVWQIVFPVAVRVSLGRVALLRFGHDRLFSSLSDRPRRVLLLVHGPACSYSPAYQAFVIVMPGIIALYASLVIAGFLGPGSSIRCRWGLVLTLAALLLFGLDPAKPPNGDCDLASAILCASTAVGPWSDSAQIRRPRCPGHVRTGRIEVDRPVPFRARCSRPLARRGVRCDPSDPVFLNDRRVC